MERETGDPMDRTEQVPVALTSVARVGAGGSGRRCLPPLHIVNTEYYRPPTKLCRGPAVIMEPVVVAVTATMQFPYWVYVSGSLPLLPLVSAGVLIKNKASAAHPV